MARVFSIYLITNRANGKRYVGQTIKSARARLSEHVATALRGEGQTIGAAIRKHGAACFRIFCIETCETKERADALETRWIRVCGSRSTLGRGYNLTDGGEGTPGMIRPPVSQETREKMSKAHKGKPFSDAHKQKLSESLRGRPIGVAQRELLSRIHMGHRLPDSPEIRAKISKALRGRVFSQAHRENLSKAMKASEACARVSQASRGRTLSQAHRENLSKALMGRTLSQTHRENLSKALVGRTLSESHHKNVSAANVRRWAK